MIAGYPVADWLNHSHGAAKRRVIDLIKSFATVRSTITTYVGKVEHIVAGRRFSGHLPKEVVDGSLEYRKAQSVLNRQLRRHRPRIHYPLGGGQWVASWEIAGKKQGKGFRLTESDMIELLFEAARSGQLERLRECRCGCEKWLWASNLRKLFYNDDCRTRHHNQRPKTDAFRKHRREYMRRRRANKQE